MFLKIIVMLFIKKILNIISPSISLIIIIDTNNLLNIYYYTLQHFFEIKIVIIIINNIKKRVNNCVTIIKSKK